MSESQRGHHSWSKDLKRKKKKKKKTFFETPKMGKFTQEWLIDAKEYLDKSQTFLENVLWTGETKIELFRNAHQKFIYRRRNEAHKEENSLPTVQHGGRSIMLCSCFAAPGTRSFDCTREIMESENYPDILEQHVLPSARKLGLSKRSLVLQQDTDSKHTPKSMHVVEKGKKIDCFEMASNESWP